MRPELGFHWVRRYEGEASRTGWLLMEWDGDGWLGMDGQRYSEIEIQSVGPAVLPPDHPNLQPLINRAAAQIDLGRQTGADGRRMKQANIYVVAADLVERLTGERF